MLAVMSAMVLLPYGSGPAENHPEPPFVYRHNPAAQTAAGAFQKRPRNQADGYVQKEPRIAIQRHSAEESAYYNVLATDRLLARRRVCGE